MARYFHERYFAPDGQYSCLLLCSQTEFRKLRSQCHTREIEIAARSMVEFEKRTSTPAPPPVRAHSLGSAKLREHAKRRQLQQR
jgi:hypothetical protein